jgi:hypothetical protein
MRCTSLTLTGRKCRKNSVVNDLCAVHHKQTCLICLEEVSSLNSKNSKKLSCHHSFHYECILEWYKQSDLCPTCRQDQSDDPLIVFKKHNQEEVRQIYQDAIRTLQDENVVLRRPRRRLQRA